MQTNTVLVVDDEQKYRELISLLLRSEGLNVTEAASGREALDMFERHCPDLIILDVMLPDISGFDVCKQIRKKSDVPILFLSALEEEGYHVIGYRSGADDYIAKPFQSSIFTLKVKRILERINQLSGSKGYLLRSAGIALDTRAHECTVDGAPVLLTQKEFAILHELMRNKGLVLTRDYLLQKIWGYDYLGDTRAIDTQIKKLRKKLVPYSACIRTIISVGYKLED